jgi:hypothetical protein
MAKTPNARPTADGVDPITPVPEGDGVTKTQNPETLAQTTPDTAPASDAAPVEGAKTLNEQSPNLTKEDDTKPLPGNGSEVETTMITVKTKDKNVILMDPFSGYHVEHDAVEVPVTSWINDELAEGGRLEKA